MSEPQAERVLLCPVCGARLEIERESGVSVDVCRDHGVWLDAGELETIVARLRSRLGRKSRRHVREARRSGKIDGALWGWWSLLGD